MTTITHVPERLADVQLLEEVSTLARRERHATVQLIAALSELDTRRLYLGQGYSSLFTYCTRGLHLSESAAYRRIEAARAARQFPAILHMLADGALTLTSVCLLARHLTQKNHRTVLDVARYCSKRDVEAQVAALQPRPPVRSECGFLEIHHVVPFAEGGPTRSANLQLRCRAHNAYEAQQYFGEWLTG